MEREADVSRLKEELHAAKEQLARQPSSTGPHRAPAMGGQCGPVLPPACPSAHLPATSTCLPACLYVNVGAVKHLP
jgi:hypothetical protein